MSYFSDNVCASAGRVISTRMDLRTEASKVPDAEDIALEKNQGVYIDGCYVYADMADSSALGQSVKKPVAAKIIRSYINGAADILRHYGGEVRSFDGDRVMAIFIGSDKETKAVRAALGVNWFVSQFLADRIDSAWTDLKEKNIFTLAHRIGIDTGEALLTRTGVRGDNDLISVGAEPNVAAKLSDLKGSYSLYITKEVYDPMSNDVAYFENGSPMWHQLHAPQSFGGSYRTVLGSTAYWQPA